MRIGFYTNCYEPRINGVVRSISTFREALRNSGQTVFLFAPAAPGYVDRDPEVYRYPTLPIENGRLYRLPIPISPRLARLTAGLGLEIVHTHHPVMLGWVAAHQARAAGVPLVYTVHSQYARYWDHLALGSAAMNACCRRAVVAFMRRCQRIIAPTATVRGQIVADLPELEPRVVVVPTPLPSGAFSAAESRAIRERYGLGDRFTFVVTARLSPEKGLSELLQAFAALQHRRQNVRLLIIGDGPERATLERKAEELHVSSVVVFAGMVPFGEVAAHLQAADAFVFSAQREVQPLVLSEAMASGLPVVAYDAPFVRDVIVDGVSGLLSQPHFRALAVKMAMLVDDADLRRSLAEAGKRAAQQFSATQGAENLLRVYEEAIEDLRREARRHLARAADDVSSVA